MIQIEQTSKTRRQAMRFFMALSFLTRIPSPEWVIWNEDDFQRSRVYYPLVGWVIGGSAALLFWLSHFLFGVWVSVFVSMAWTLWLTRAFHEDGWADFCDGFGGGYSRDKILEIMKDPRTGTFGNAGLWLMLTGKLLCLASLPPSLIPWVLLGGHSLSRAFACIFLTTHKYVRVEEDKPKIAALANPLSRNSLLVALGVGAAPLFLIDIPLLFIGSLLSLAALYAYFGNFIKREIGGYTGDCLGAAQQLSEVLFYLTALAWIKLFT